MKRFNCDKAGCAICSNAKVVNGIFGIKRYECPNHPKAHKKVKAKDCLAFRCNTTTFKKECTYCRRGERKVKIRGIRRDV